jgi:hypothetical protein
VVQKKGWLLVDGNELSGQLSTGAIIENVVEVREAILED